MQSAMPPVGTTVRLRPAFSSHLNFMAIAHGEVAEVTAFVHQPTLTFSAACEPWSASTLRETARLRTLMLCCMLLLQDRALNGIGRYGGQVCLRLIAHSPCPMRSLRLPPSKPRPRTGCGAAETRPCR